MTEPAPIIRDWRASLHAVPETDDRPLTAARPEDISGMVGQTVLVNQLRILAAGAKLRGTPIPHILLSGPAGFGKTTLAGIIAGETGGELMVTNGMTLRKSSDLLGLLIKLTPNAVLFIDEVHRLPTTVMEALYTALEDRCVDLLIGSGKSTRAYRHELPVFTCVGATTQPGQLAGPFRDRFGFHGQLEPYTVEELTEIVRRAWVRRGVTFGAGEPRQVAERCKGVPRLALHLAERVLDYAAMMGSKAVDAGRSGAALTAFGIDDRGLDKVDWRILDALVNTFQGRCVGVATICQAIDIDPSTFERQHEGPLVRAGLMQRTQAGRMALPAAHEMFRPTLPLASQ